MKGAIIIPTYNEATNIQNALDRLQALRKGWLVIVSDGGSIDNTLTLAKPGCDVIVQAALGRASQQNEGALKAREILGLNGILVFLHADTRLPHDFEAVMSKFLHTGRQWGRFDVRLSGNARVFRLIEFMINQRSRLSGIATGDQTLFFRSEFFWQLNGFPMLPLMEDVEISKRAKGFAKPFCAMEQVVTSSRKWEKEGVLKTITLMWWCRFAYFIGVRAQTIHRWYYGR